MEPPLWGQSSRSWSIVGSACAISPLSRTNRRPAPVSCSCRRRWDQGGFRRAEYRIRARLASSDLGPRLQPQSLAGGQLRDLFALPLRHDQRGNLCWRLSDSRKLDFALDIWRKSPLPQAGSINVSVQHFWSLTYLYGRGSGFDKTKWGIK